ncbi:MAG: O-antigen ligase family protein, partial [Acidobacteria bacterium]|nr:O-antigen ligase family protein [Acidobacteriota bacterium]
MKKVERLALAGLLVAVGMAVAGYGGVEPVWFAGVELLLFGVGLVGVVGLSDETLAGLPWMPLLVMGLVVVQWLPWPRPLSVAPYETETHLLRLVAYLVAFYWAVLLAAREEGRARLAGGLVAVGTAAGLYGIAQYVSAHSLDYNATGPYVNRNHFAGLLEMLLPLALGWTLAQGRGARSSWREWWTRAEAQKGWLGLVAAVVIFSAIVFSRSRMGWLSTLFALLVMSLGMSWGASPRMSAAGPLAVVLAGAALFSLWVGVDPVVARFGQAFADPGRPPIWADTGRLIREHPWLGTGWGTFPLAYPAVQTAHLGRRVSHAHNDYL